MCILPHYNKQTAQRVVRKVLFDQNTWDYAGLGSNPGAGWEAIGHAQGTRKSCRGYWLPPGLRASRFPGSALLSIHITMTTAVGPGPTLPAALGPRNWAGNPHGSWTHKQGNGGEWGLRTGTNRYKKIFPGSQDGRGCHHCPRKPNVG